ncbi:MAG: redoxin family protein [Pirellulales bacterium]
MSCSFATQGEEAVDFTVQSATDDSSFQLSKQRGKVVVLHFLLKTECPFCMKYTRDYALLAEKQPEVVHVFLKPDSAAEIAAWAGKLDSTDLKGLPTIYRDVDAKLADQFKVPGGYNFHGETIHYPALIALDENGKELFRYVGKSNSDRMATDDFVVKLTETTGRRSKTSAVEK